MLLGLRKFLIVFPVFLLLSSAFSSGIKLDDDIEIKFELEDKKFYIDQEIEGELEIENFGDKEIPLYIKAEIIGDFISSPPQPQEFFINIPPNSKRMLEIEFEPAIHTLKYSKYNFTLTVARTDENFKIKSLIEEFEIIEKEFELFSCKDENCFNRQSIFYENEKVCLNYINKLDEKPTFKLFSVYPSYREYSINLPTCLINLSKGTYVLQANFKDFSYNATFSIIKNFNILKPSVEKRNLEFLVFFIPIVIFSFLIFVWIKKRRLKGQISFFSKVIFIVLSSLLFLFLFYYYQSFQKSVLEERLQSEFKNEVLNLANKLISSEECLSYRGEKNVLDLNKIELFERKYQDVEPTCAKKIDFDYSIEIIQIGKEIKVLPNIKKFGGTLAWVVNSGCAISGDSSLSLVSISGREIRRHYTVPMGVCGSPSRTAVDSQGNAWVGNRGVNTLVKIAFDKKDCIDKNGNGIIETSEDENGDGEVTPDEMLPFDEDECIVKNVILGNNLGYGNIRAVCIDKNDNVYAGHWHEKKIYYVDKDGNLLNSWNVGGSPYGCVVDKVDNNIVYISAAPSGVIRLDTTNGQTIFKNAPSYGIWVCPDGSCVVVNGGRLYKLNSKNLEIICTNNKLTGGAGIFVDEENNIYSLNVVGDVLTKYDSNCNIIKEVPTCGSPKGISSDYLGNLWVICYTGGVKVFDKDLATVSEFAIKGSHYGYSDFTGYLTGAKLIGVEVKPIREEYVGEKRWKFSLTNFSPEKAKKSEIRISIPVTIRYNETFAANGLIQIYAVRGELETLFSVIEDLCKNAELELNFSRKFHFSYPVKYSNGKLCMLDSCKKFICDYDLDFEDLEEGDYLLKFSSNKTLRKIIVRK